MASFDHVRWLAQPELRRPVIIAAFSGWNDAADAASTAVRTLVDAWGAEPLAEIDPEEFTDFATVRPSVALERGAIRKIVWPKVSMWYASTPGTDVILLLGPEPSLRWRLFTEQIISVAVHFDAAMVISLGALLADVPHNRPVQLIGTATDATMIERFDLQRSRYEGPTGIVGVLHDACNDAEIPSASLWAAVPAYASQIPSPKASSALIQRAGEIIGTPAPIGALHNAIVSYEERVDDLVSEDEDLAAYVERLDSMGDNVFEDDGDDQQLSLFDSEDDDGSSLVDEVEQFLREQDGH
jgi:proteasome assembly chaperone (PAC2) family protein